MSSDDNSEWSDKECMDNFLNDVCGRSYKDQGAFFMNAYWKEYFTDIDEMENKAKHKMYFNTEKLLKKNKLDKSDLKPLPNAEKVWLAFKYFQILDKKNAKQTAQPSLDESPGSHRLLELMAQPMTILEFRKEFKKIDQNHDNRMGLIEYLIYKYNEKQDPKKFICEMMRRPQGTNQELIKAEKELEKVQAEIQKIEDHKADLLKQSKGKGVKAKIAQQKLNIILAGDGGGVGLELRKALIRAESAVKKAKKKGSAAAEGKLFFLDRELEEAKMYKPSGSK